MIWMCKDCGAEFDEPGLVDEGPQDDMYPQASRLYSYICPNCGSAEIEEADSCRICGAPIIEGEFCKRCKGTVQESLLALQKFLKTDGDTIEAAICELKGW